MIYDEDKAIARPPQDAPWPVAARNLLSQREQAFYELLRTAFPGHCIFPQVALSQLVDVPRREPNRQSIRNRFSQFVVDFVLYRDDMRFVAAIELDDRSHERPDRQDADQRKTRALRDAGLKLVRVAAGPLPSAASLRALVIASVGDGASAAALGHAGGTDFESLLGDAFVEPPDVVQVQTASPSLLPSLARPALALIVLVLGGYLYLHLSRSTAGAPLAPGASRGPESATAVGQPPSVPATFTQSRDPMTFEAGHQSAVDATERSAAKDAAWAAHYKPASSCLSPPSWSAQVECGNEYMRARRRFEASWAQEHGGPSPGDIVLDNRSVPADAEGWAR